MYQLYAKLPDQVVCRERQESALWRWSAYILAGTIPTTKPSKAWVQQRLMAARIPIDTMQHVIGTIGFTAQSPDIQTNIRQHLNAFNDEATEAAMDLQVDGAVSTAMPVYCAQKIVDSEVEKWYADNGFS